MKETSKTVIKYLQGLDADARVTAADVANATGLTAKQVNTVFNFSVQKKDLGARVIDTIPMEDGKTKEIKYLVLNAAGRALDCDAEPVTE